MTPPAEFKTTFAAADSARTANQLAAAAVTAAKDALQIARCDFGLGQFRRSAAADYAARVRVRDAETALRQAEAALSSARAALHAADREHDLVCAILGLSVAS
ncbi:MAG TPA: hypothetical protein VGP07_11785 [Polyangia bacterium]|jgi:hypothetical protein